MEIMRDAKEILSRLEAYYLQADTTNGTFNLDAWSLGEIAEKIGVDKQKFTQAMLGLFRKTVATLAPGIPVLERR